MNKAKILKQIYVTAKNEVGQMALITSCIAEKKVNIAGICAWQNEGNACFAILTNDNAKAIGALKERGLSPKEEEVAGLILEDKIGSAAEVAKKIKQAGIDLNYIYGTTCGCESASALLILKSKDIAQLVKTINA